MRVFNVFWMLLLTAAPLHGAPFRQITWDDLLPEPTETNTPAASDEQRLMDPFGFDLPTGVVAALNGKEVRIPGFIVPLEGDEVGSVSEFFLVPYFGACIHTPPPPPNQIVFVKTAEPFPLETMWEPVWIEGTIRTEEVATDLGVAGYSLRAVKIEPYVYER